MLFWKVNKYMHLAIGKWCKFCHIIWNLKFWVNFRNHLYLILVWKAGKLYIRTIHGYSWFKYRAVDVNIVTKWYDIINRLHFAGKIYIRTIHGYSLFKYRAVVVNIVTKWYDIVNRLHFAGKLYIRTIHGYSWFKYRAVDVNIVTKWYEIVNGHVHVEV